ncbi:alkaline phosphatase family protein [bacterium]|nr:alkaline phosphatase family protein [bacterium]
MLIAVVLMLASNTAFAAEPKVIILGFDGMDLRLVHKYMDEGLMPNMQKLQGTGHLGRLDTTNPSESPVAWASFAVGGNPGKTGIYDFLRRMPGSYFPEFATVTPGTKEVLPSDALRWGIAAGAGVVAALLLFFLLRLVTRSTITRLVAAIVPAVCVFGASAYVITKWVPKELPIPIGQRQGTAFWNYAADAGMGVTAIRVPVTFPAEDFGGKLLSGLGVPDVRQTNGTFTVYSTQKMTATNTEMGGKLVPVTMLGDRIEAKVLGPRNFTLKDNPDVTVPFVAKINKAAKTADITCQGQTRTVKMGEFSDFFTFDFALNPLVHLSGIAKFALLAVEPDVRIYLTPVNFDPAKLPPTVRISAPADFAPMLHGQHGPFKTIGWQEETWALNELQISEELFLADLFETMSDIEKIVYAELDKRDARLFIGVFEATDRLQHMFWRYLDEKHPLYDADEAAKHSEAFRRLYAKIDQIIGRVMEQNVDDDTHLFVMSDHGFQSFRKAVNINTWLVENGFMALKGQEPGTEFNLDQLFGKGEFWPNVDWSRTKAYHIGLGNIYINLFGREPQGVVHKLEYEKVQNEIREGLKKLIDPETGEPVVIDVYPRQEIYKGPAFDLAPDLILGFAEGYRISWQSALGGMPKGVILPNDRKWSGDHCSVDPSLTYGVLASNRKITKDAPIIYDLAPTALSALGVDLPGDIDGKPLY